MKTKEIKLNAGDLVCGHITSTKPALIKRLASSGRRRSPPSPPFSEAERKLYSEALAQGDL